MITTDAVCVSDSVKSVENHKTIEDIKQKLDSLKSDQPRERESQFLGLHVYQNSDEVMEFEWDSKTQNNMVVAIFQRHLSARVQPEQMVIERLGFVTNALLNTWVRNLPEISIPPVEEWVKSKDFPLNKANKYLRVIHKQLHHPTQQNFQGAFELMVKSGEVQYTTTHPDKDST